MRTVLCILNTFVLFLGVSLPASAQTWVNIPKSNTMFRSFTGSGESFSEYYQFFLTFPTTVEHRAADDYCHTDWLQYEFWDWLAADATSPVPARIWSGPLSGNIRGEPGTLYVTNSSVYAKGLRFTGAFGGKILSNTDPDQSNPKNAVTEALFTHTQFCYDGGPEFGFYRRLITPSTFSEERNIYFYYSDVTNCGGFAWGYLNSPSGSPVWQTRCKVPLTGSFVAQTETPTVAIPIPAGLNSEGQWDYTYSAYLIDDSTFRLEVRDPYNGTLMSDPIDHRVQDFFGQWTREMWNGGFPAFVTLVMQKSLDRDIDYNNRGDITGNTFDYPGVGARSLSVLETGYLVGDVHPWLTDQNGDNDIWDFGEFGDYAIAYYDVIFSLRAVTYIPGYRPASCADYFDAVDSHPKDASGVRGGDGALNTLDLIVTNKRYNGTDPSRPRRAPRGLYCPSGAASPGAEAMAAGGGATSVTLQLGVPARHESGSIRVPVYAVASADRELSGVAYAVGLRGRKLPLRFIAGALAPSLVDEALPGIVAVAWLGDISIPANQLVLLGFIEIGGADPKVADAAFEVFRVVADFRPESQQGRSSAGSQQD